jgi:phosphoheptose isomerase/glycosyltransferase involved in cell wall biosynthesis
MISRVALISEHASPLVAYGGVDSGGQNVYVDQIAFHLTRLNIEVDVFTRRTSASIPQIVTWRGGVRIINIAAGPPCPLPKEELLPYMEEFSCNILKFIQEAGQRYDIVHANFWMSGLAAVYLKRKLDLPFTITFHALGKVRRAFLGENDTWGDERLELEQRVMEAADAIIATCPQERNDLLNLYTVSPNKIRLVPCGFNNLEFWPIRKEKARSVIDFPQGEFILLNVGRLVERKGIDNIIHAIAYLSEHHGIRVKLAIVGGETDTPAAEDTPEIGRLMNLAIALGVKDQVLFAGRRDRFALKCYYSAADVFVTTPWYEPFGITPLESMACGTPVIGSRVGGIQYTVSHQVTGLLVEPNNPEELADAILTLYRNPQLLKKYAEQASVQVGRFQWDKLAAAVLLVYEDVLTTERLYWGKRLSPVYNAINSLESACHQVDGLLPYLVMAVAKIRHCFANGGKLLIAGNGGSAAQGQHLAAELVGQFQSIRSGLPALALTADTALITAWANDVGFNDIFARQVEALGNPGDLFLAISTSGMSPNLIRAIEKCQEKHISTIALVGQEGGEIGHMVDTVVLVPGINTQRIQEMQLFVLHLLVEMLESQEEGLGRQENVILHHPLSFSTQEV